MLTEVKQRQMLITAHYSLHRCQLVNFEIIFEIVQLNYGRKISCMNPLQAVAKIKPLYPHCIAKVIHCRFKSNSSLGEYFSAFIFTIFKVALLAVMIFQSDEASRPSHILSFTFQILNNARITESETDMICSAPNLYVVFITG